MNPITEFLTQRRQDAKGTKGHSRPLSHSAKGGEVRIFLAHLAPLREMI